MYSLMMKVALEYKSLSLSLSLQIKANFFKYLPLKQYVRTFVFVFCFWKQFVRLVFKSILYVSILSTLDSWKRGWASLPFFSNGEPSCGGRRILLREENANNDPKVAVMGLALSISLIYTLSRQLEIDCNTLEFWILRLRVIVFFLF